MKIKEVKAEDFLDSRGNKTIGVYVNGFLTIAPAGKSTGKHEVPSYYRTLFMDIITINKTDFSHFSIDKFEDLIIVERKIKKKIGGNTLFALEASILKALAYSKGIELWQLLGGKKLPKLLSNTVGGGLHSHNYDRPEFQEFLVIGEFKKNLIIYKKAGKLLKSHNKNDENAWQTEIPNEGVLDIISKLAEKKGLDIAASSFYKDGKYHYKKEILNRNEQINYVLELIKSFKLNYVEDPLCEEDFRGFAELLKKTRNCLIVGDDLTTTNFQRVSKAIKMHSINGLIVKPNQIGSLVEVKKVIQLCKKNGIKIIISHRSGETLDNTIADLAVGWNADYIKIPVFGKERLAKINRLMEIKRKMN